VLPDRPTFSAFPFDRLPRVARRDLVAEAAIARWIVARPLGAHVARLAGGPARVRLVGLGSRTFDPHPALAEVRIDTLSIVLAASSRPIRVLAQRLLGGPAELDAPRPLGTAEHAIWALAVAAAIADTGIAAEVWPIADAPHDALTVELAIDVAGTAMTVMAMYPREVVVRVPPARPIPGWTFELPVIVARCWLPRRNLRTLALRDVIVVERGLALVIGDGKLDLTAPPGAVVATVATGYVRRDMALPDDAHFELTVQLGTTRLSLRQIGELAVGQVVTLGRPLGGPYEVRAGGRLVGQGELVDVDGELGVRIVSLIEE
jgi:flagellar motor switch/type III secretory pathway protein FliN